MQRYVSNELTHFVGRSLPDNEARYQILIKILTTGQLLHPPFNLNLQEFSAGGSGKFSEHDVYTEQVLCFCDIPIGDLSIHMEKYSRFGLSFPKPYLVAKGANPVFYIAKTSMITPAFGAEAFAVRTDMHRHFHLGRSEYFDRLMTERQSIYRQLEPMVYNERFKPIDHAVAEMSARFFHFIEALDVSVFCFFKFFDETLPAEDEGNFYMEREWRLMDHLTFTLPDVERVILPRAYAGRLRGDVPDYFGQITFAENPA